MRSLRSSINNNLIENEEEQYWIEYINVRYHEDGISISQIQESWTPAGFQPSATEHGHTNKLAEFYKEPN